MVSLKFEPVRVSGARTDQMTENALESILVASTFDTDVSGIESGSHVFEFTLESGGALA